jgi:hypothetical protein
MKMFYLNKFFHIIYIYYHRFRIAAVYSNNDNKLGPNSGKFVLEKEPPKRKPAFSPLIDTAEAVSPSAIMIHWMVKVYKVI